MPQKHYHWKLGQELPSIGKHSLAKHRILASYIQKYLEIVTAISFQEELNITFVDGYCGGGKYQNGKDEITDGSPLLLLNTVSLMEERLNAGRPKGFRINCRFIFIDVNKHHTDFLRAEIEKSPHKEKLDNSISIINADFNNMAQEIIDAVKARSPKRGRAIFLLDQYGWSQVSFTNIRAILEQLDKAEIFLTFSVDSLIDYLSIHNYDMKAFGSIEMDTGLVKELIRIKEEEQIGYRALIQNTLYTHIQATTGAPFYSPFFIKSIDAHRSYLFIHLSNHREARNVIGEIHWQENNTSAHSGGAGLNALGFTPDGANLDQLSIGFLFDENARVRSEKTLNEQLPRIIIDSMRDGPPTLETLFESRCNETPVVRDMFARSLVQLRNQKEIIIVDASGKEKPRSKTIEWTDRVRLPDQTTFLGPFSTTRRK